MLEMHLVLQSTSLTNALYSVKSPSLRKKGDHISLSQESCQRPDKYFMDGSCCYIANISNCLRLKTFLQVLNKCSSSVFFAI